MMTNMFSPQMSGRLEPCVLGIEARTARDALFRLLWGLSAFDHRTFRVTRATFSAQMFAK
jgi:hypothetical protein